ncbi:yqjA [Wigglesworthia glossinidia endosymbiont of Glossina brevipalpis]|uniref:YqjA protein n=1 Tax=Wigglesworthia glossinidia brevipalpis TaxID=36870 RepID=Q8D2C4_WIGBR|nr:yqjA [Wigglesworthia glossinidia endosymbiont of Glossina brevipalpis]
MRNIMESIKELYKALLDKNLEFLSQNNIIWLIYFISCIIIILENGLLILSFLPGDSLLILLGILVSKNIINFYFLIFSLTISASIGSWIGYLQGKWLKKNKFFNSLIKKFSSKYFNKAYKIFHIHGFISLFIGRFLVFIRTILPIIFGLFRLNKIKFFFFNVVSSFVWIFVLTFTGFLLGKISFFQKYENVLIIFFCIFQLIIILFSIIYLFYLYIKKN